jgi:CRP/FNR family transcriptional regulator, cyclic AMP receptor protein
MNGAIPTKFDPLTFLAQAGLGRRIVHLNVDQHFFTQGAPATCVFYLQTGRAKLTVVSGNGKEATITLLGASDFIGEESLAGVPGWRRQRPLPIVWPLRSSAKR